MKKYYNEVQKNPLKTKQDVQNAVIQLCEPLIPFYTEGFAKLHVGNTGANYHDSLSEVEAFIRPLWGLAPLIGGGGNTKLWDIYVEGIRNGSNPKHPEYWGDIIDFDQRSVEMTAVALILLISPEKLLNHFNEEEKNNLFNWLEQINHFGLADNNWRFFRVLVNVALKKLGGPFSQEAMDAALTRIDDFYHADGWYSDGNFPRLDYYIPFAFHFYGLIYAKAMENDDVERSNLYKERAKVFAKDFIHWFAADGSALPFGRSLTYRFAECAFWGAIAFAGVEVFPWGVVKGIVLRHLRWWVERPIFNNDGILSIGYAYPNLIMTESYNAPGSPYWSMKAFLPLALPESHPFWASEEEPLPALDKMKVEKHPMMIFCRNEDQSHILAFSSGQYWGEEWAHSAAKYGKFVYSNVFGFSVPKSQYGLSLGAYDSTLALSECDNQYRTRVDSKSEVRDNMLYSVWNPWKDVEVQTWLIPGTPWHVRVHKINSSRCLDIAEGSFAIERMGQTVGEDIGKIVTKDSVASSNARGMSGIVNIRGYEKAELINTEPNTNLLYNRTAIPTLVARIDKGIHILVSAVFGEVPGSSVMSAWENRPIIEIEGSAVKIKNLGGKEVIVNLDEKH